MLDGSFTVENCISKMVKPTETWKTIHDFLHSVIRIKEEEDRVAQEAERDGIE